jgi:hypothetical protein
MDPGAPFASLREGARDSFEKSRGAPGVDVATSSDLEPVTASPSGFGVAGSSSGDSDGLATGATEPVVPSPAHETSTIAQSIDIDRVACRIMASFYLPVMIFL